jgi:hypothetical protein
MQTVSKVHSFTLFVLYIRITYQYNTHYATNQQVAGSIPNGVIGVFQ